MQKQRQKYLMNLLDSYCLPLKKHLYWLLSLITAATVIQIFAIASLVDAFINDNSNYNSYYIYFIVILLSFLVKSVAVYYRTELTQRMAGKIRNHIRQEVLKRCQSLGAKGLGHNPPTLSIFYLEQVDLLNNYIARFYPQTLASKIQPMIVLLAVFSFNWVAGLVLLFTAPLLPVFMILIGLKTSEMNARQLKSLLYLGNQFHDKLSGIKTIIAYNREEATLKAMTANAQNYTDRTMTLLRVAFLNSAVLEFLSSICIALMAIYFGISYLEHYTFGTYIGARVSLFAGFFCLTLAGEFYQPFKDLGTFYHDRSSALNAIDELDKFINQPAVENQDFVDVEHLYSEEEANPRDRSAEALYESSWDSIAIASNPQQNALRRKASPESKEGNNQSRDSLAKDSQTNHSQAKDSLDKDKQVKENQDKEKQASKAYSLRGLDSADTVTSTNSEASTSSSSKPSRTSRSSETTISSFEESTSTNGKATSASSSEARSSSEVSSSSKSQTKDKGRRKREKLPLTFLDADQAPLLSGLNYPFLKAKENSVFYSSEQQPQGNLFTLDGESIIKAKNLTIYTHSGKVLVENLNFAFQLKEKIAIVGLSGAGKTSLLSVLMGLYPYQGSLTFNGKELTDIDKEQFYAYFSWLGQNPNLDQVSLLENIYYRGPYLVNHQDSPPTIREGLKGDNKDFALLLQKNNDLSNYSIAQAIKLSRLEALFATKGSNFMVQQHNIGLSGGQVQRIALARALAKPHLYLVIDEPTANLDDNLEQAIFANIARHPQGVLMVTHRLEHAQYFDKVYHLDGKLRLVKEGETIYDESALRPSFFSEKKEEGKKSSSFSTKGSSSSDLASSVKVKSPTESSPASNQATMQTSNPHQEGDYL